MLQLAAVKGISQVVVSRIIIAAPGMCKFNVADYLWLQKTD